MCFGFHGRSHFFREERTKFGTFRRIDGDIVGTPVRHMMFAVFGHATGELGPQPTGTVLGFVHLRRGAGNESIVARRNTVFHTNKV